jgi:hypothetical protein
MSRDIDSLFAHFLQPARMGQPARRFVRSLLRQMRQAERNAQYTDALAEITRLIDRRRLGLPASEFRKVLREMSVMLTSLACAFVVSRRMRSARGERSVRRRRSVRLERSEQNRSKGTGKTWRSLREFPERIERMAQEIQQINKSAVAAPYRQIGTVKTGLDKRTCHTLRALPQTMQVYAESLRQRIWLLAALYSSSFPSNSTTLGFLTDNVYYWTGKYHDELVADLLCTAGHALDCELRFDALRIAKFRHLRNKSSGNAGAKT